MTAMNYLPLLEALMTCQNPASMELLFADALSQDLTLIKHPVCACM